MSNDTFTADDLRRYYKDLAIVFVPRSMDFTVEWGNYGEDDTLKDRFESVEAAKKEIDKVITSKRSKLKLQTNLPVIYANDDRWSKKGETGRATLVGIHKGTSNLITKEKIGGDSYHSRPRLYPDTPWVMAQIELRKKLQKELERQNDLLSKIEITASKFGHHGSRIDDEAYQQVFEAMVKCHADLTEKAKRYEEKLPDLDKEDGAE